MYADRSDRRFHINPTSMAVALAINGGVLAALFLAAPEWVPGQVERPALTTRNIPLPPEPVPIPPEPQPTTDSTPLLQPAPAPLPRPDMPTPLADVPSTGPVFDIGPLPTPLPPVRPGGTGTGTRPVETPAPVMVGVSVDPRFADRFQPAYPPSEQREGRDGQVVVRVLVGTDGRVKAIERVSATSDAFFAATRRQALSQWRFRPATRDGVGIESWYRMSVTFVLN